MISDCRKEVKQFPNCDIAALILSFSEQSMLELKTMEGGYKNPIYKNLLHRISESNNVLMYEWSKKNSLENLKELSKSYSEHHQQFLISLYKDCNTLKSISSLIVEGFDSERLGKELVTRTTKKSEVPSKEIKEKSDSIYIYIVLIVIILFLSLISGASIIQIIGLMAYKLILIIIGLIFTVFLINFFFKDPR